MKKGASKSSVAQLYRVTDMDKVFRWAFYLWRARHNCTNEGHIILPQGRCAACGVIPAVLEPPSAEAVREHALK